MVWSTYLGIQTFSLFIIHHFIIFHLLHFLHLLILPLSVWLPTAAPFRTGPVLAQGVEGGEGGEGGVWGHLATLDRGGRGGGLGGDVDSNTVTVLQGDTVKKN